LSVSAGELVWVKGPNGAGKSTLLQTLAGILSPTIGTILWEGNNISNNAAYAENRSYLGDRDALNQNLTLDENIALQLALVDKSYSPSASIVCTLLEDLQLMHQRKQLSQYLSRGQRRKTALVALFLKACPLWIMDEPFTALDQKSTQKVEQYCDNHMAKGGMIIMASHTSQCFLQVAKTTVVDICDLAV